jgi:acyl-CoA synthetase (NDP forming)
MRCKRMLSLHSLLSGIVLLLWVVSNRPAQEPPCSQRTVLATVIDKPGNPVRGLSAANFRGEFRGHTVQIISATLDTRPRRIVLLVDASGSMTAADSRRKWDAAKMIATALATGQSWLLPEETDFLLDCYGIPKVKTVKAVTPVEAAEAATALGGKVVLKGVAEGLVHRSEVGAVNVGLAGGPEVRAAAGEMANNLASKGYKVTGFVVQPLIPSGPEIIVGVKNDATFGPVLACGSGGVLVELLSDLSIRIAPLTSLDATEMVSSLRVYPLLIGYRGGPKYDVKVLEEVILRVASLADDQPGVAEIDLNPIILRPLGQGATVVDARVRLQESG